MINANEAKMRATQWKNNRQAEMEAEVIDWMEKELCDQIQRFSANGWTECRIDLGANANDERYAFITATLHKLGYTFERLGKSVLCIYWS
jgi:hypothetical protein